MTSNEAKHRKTSALIRLERNYRRQMARMERARRILERAAEAHGTASKAALRASRAFADALQAYEAAKRRLEEYHGG